MRAASQRSQSSTFWSSGLVARRRQAPTATSLRRVDQPPHLVAFAGDHHVLLVAHVRHRTHALAARVVDPDLRAHVAAGVERQHLDVAVHRAHVAQLVGVDPRLVVVRHHHDAGLHRGDDAAERVGHQPTPVEHALGGVVARVDALARHAVVLGRVPRDQRLPHVVVGEVAVLVVRRVEVREVALGQRRRHVERVAAARATPVPGEQLGDAQRERQERTRSPTASRTPSARRWWSRRGRPPRSGS